MRPSDKPWLYIVFILAILIGPLFDYWVPRVSDRADALLHIASNLLPFAVMFFIFRKDGRIPRRVWIIALGLLMLAYLFFDPFASKLLFHLDAGDLFSRSIAKNAGLSRFVGHLVTIGHGWLVPMLILSVFVVVLLYKHRMSVRGRH